MTRCNKCQGGKTKVTILSAYEADGLGAPFKVVLQNSVKLESCGDCGEVLATYIPDMAGLFCAVVFARALEPRKLSGAEIRFMRKAMGWKAKDVAKELEMTPEHFSRCENGTKVMAPTSEKLFRICALLQTPDRSALDEIGLSKLYKLVRIEPMWDVREPLEFRFSRSRPPAERIDGNDGKWRNEKRAA